MEKKIGARLLFIAGLFAILGTFFINILGGLLWINYGYKKGQIDAMNGIIKYETVESKYQYKNWERMEE